MAEDIWPHILKKQNEQSTLLMERLLGWKHLITGLSTFFAEVILSEANYARSYARLATAIPTNSLSVFGKLGASVAGIGEQAREISERHQSIYTHIEGTIGHELDRLRDKIDKETTLILHEMCHLQDTVRIARIEAANALESYQKAYWSAEAVQDQLPGDPWLNQIIFHLRLSKLQKAHLSYGTALQGFYSDLKKMDQYCCESLERVAHALLVWEQELAAEGLPRRSIARTLTEAIPSEQFDEYAKRVQLDLSFQHQLQFPVLDYRYRNGPLSAISKQGFLQRRVGAVKSTWKDTFAVISEAGYVHCYDVEESGGLPDKSSPTFSMNLRKVLVETTVSRSTVAPLVIELTQLTASRFGGHRTLSLLCPNQDDLVAWEHVITVKSKTGEDTPQHHIFDDEEDDFLVVADKPATTNSPPTNADPELVTTASSSPPKGAPNPPMTLLASTQQFLANTLSRPHSNSR